MRSAIRFAKGHALGNDYVVIDEADLDAAPTARWIRALCDRRRGVGADGLLLADTAADPVRLRIFNPDGTEAEKSGNGLRIFAAYLHGRGLVESSPFEVALAAERVSMRVEDGAADADGGGGDGRGGEGGGGSGVSPESCGGGTSGGLRVTVGMGHPSFGAADVGLRTDALGPPAPGQAGATASPGPRRLELPDGETVAIHPVSMGNPHCVIFVDELRRDEFVRVAPRVATHAAFRAGTNVQFARVAGDAALEAWVWERGVGETLASGSSACAVAAAAWRDGRITARELEIRMPGGTLEVAADDRGGLTLRGPARIVYEGELHGDVAAAW